MLYIKSKKEKNIFYTILSLIVTLLSLFFSITLLKFLISSDLNISNYILEFGVIATAFLLTFIYIYKLINYIETINCLKRINLDERNKDFFNNLIKKIKLELNPLIYLVLAISISLMYVYIFSQDNITRNLEINKFIYINKIAFLIIGFSTFEFLSVIFTFVTLHSIRQVKLKWTYIKRISHNLYLIFLNLINLWSIKFYQLRNNILNIYVNIIKKLNIYDFDQKNIISIKKRFFLADKLKGECPPNSII